MKTFDLHDVEAVVKSIANTAIANEKYFSDLDAAAGDADFGVSLATGFKVVLDKWEEYDRSSINAFLLKVSMVITGNVGGSSGPLWGTAFMRAGIKAKGKEEISLLDVASMMRSAIEGIMARGGAKVGDKTLIDGLIPVTEVFEQHAQDKDHTGVIAMATKAAEDAVETTKDWVAKRGRQSFTGERSAGTPDPGIVAIATIMKNLETVGQE
ncbi:MAG: dihydroxyacetone kinase subunit L [Cytophagales bacterium]|nr:dihydroxyacetone kinase subunit L [Cytophagales bacterium]